MLLVSSEHIPDLAKGSHNFWYNHPWVSTDVLVQLLFQARPRERGPELHEGEQGARIWHFPLDYPDRVDAAIARLQANFELGVGAIEEDAGVRDAEGASAP